MFEGLVLGEIKGEIPEWVPQPGLLTGEYEFTRWTKNEQRKQQGRIKQ